jgi:hypothetical protein
MAVYMIKVAMEAEEGGKTFKLRDIAHVENLVDQGAESRDGTR